MDVSSLPVSKSIVVVLLCKQNSTISKDIEKNLVGHPIFKQLVNLLPRDKFDLLIKQHKSDRYYKAF